MCDRQTDRHLDALTGFEIPAEVAVGVTHPHSTANNRLHRKCGVTRCVCNRNSPPHKHTHSSRITQHTHAHSCQRATGGATW